MVRAHEEFLPVTHIQRTHMICKSNKPIHTCVMWMAKVFADSTIWQPRSGIGVMYVRNNALLKRRYRLIEGIAFK